MDDVERAPTTVRSVQPSQQQKRRIQKPAPDIGPWLASLRRAHKGESVSATCFYAPQRVRPLFANARAATPRLPKDKTGNPIDAFSSGKNPGARTDLVPYYDSDDDAVAPSATLGVVEIASRAFTDPAELLATPAEVAYAGVAPAKGSGTPLYAANASDAERLNARKTPKAPRSATISELQPRNPRGFENREKNPGNPGKPRRRDVVVLRLRPVAGRRAVRRGEPRGRDDARHAPGGARDLLADAQPLGHAPPLPVHRVRRPDEREEDGGGSSREGAQGRHAFGEAREKLGRRREKLRRDWSREPQFRTRFFALFQHRNRAEREADEPSHAWDPRSIASRPGNVARLIAATINHRDSDHDGTTPEKLAAPSLRFFAAGSAVPLRCAPVTLSEVAIRARGPARRKKRVYQTDTHTKKVLDATGFVWYTVPRRDVPKLARYVRALRNDAGAEAFSKRSSFLDGDDGYATRAPGLWLDPGALAKWNASRKRKDEKIVVQRHVQRAGENFARAPGAARWGVCVGGCWLAETPSRSRRITRAPRRRGGDRT